MAGRYDWDKWRKVYVTGDDTVTLESIANIPNAPSLIAIKKTCAKESWTKQREEFRNRTIQTIYQSEQAIAAVDQINKIVDASEMVTRQGKFGRAMQNLVAKWAAQYDPTDMKPMEAVALLKLGTDLERLCAGLATESIDLQNSDRSLEPAKIVRVVIDPQNGRAYNPDS